MDDFQELENFGKRDVKNMNKNSWNSVLQKAIALLIKTREDFKKVGESLVDTTTANIDDISN